MIAITALIVFQIAFTHLSFMQVLFDNRDPSFGIWGRIIAASFSVFIPVKIVKSAMRARVKRR